MAEWDRELEVDPHEVRRAAGSPRRWRLLGAGWDCDAWLADEAVVWRVPRRTIAIEPLRREAAVMPVVAPHLSLPVPVPRLVDAPALPALARHDLVPGDELAERADDRGVGAALGVFLKALHAPEIVPEVRHLVPSDPMVRADPARRVPAALQRLDQIAHRLDVAPLRSIVAQGDGPPLPLDALTHGDLHVRHVLVGGEGAVSGVIDWGDCCVGSRAVDLGIVTALGEQEQAAFFQVYGEVDPRLWRHARLIGTHIAAALLASHPDGFVGRASLAWLARLSQSAIRQSDGEISTEPR